MTSNQQDQLHTFVISDLHLTDAEPSRPRKESRNKLWKKFKRKEFFIDDQLVEFIEHIQNLAAGASIELILNGDIFDFDSVMALPEKPIYKVHWLETRRSLLPREERSFFKLSVILEEHSLLVSALSEFVKKGHQLVYIPGNHDVEMHFQKCQKKFIEVLNLNPVEEKRVRFVSWFYISNNDTLVEHGNQQDPYCLCENPLNPFLIDYNELIIRLPFGNVACRYIVNGMGLLNPHVEKNYIMSVKDYLKFFFKYLIRAQPLIMWTWFWGSLATLTHVTFDRFSEVFKPQNGMEDLVNRAAESSQTTPEVVRRLLELFPTPATQNPIKIAKELWLDRFFLFSFGIVTVYFLFYQLQKFFNISLYWILIPLMLFLPFFMFYARSITSLVSTYKEPDEFVFAKQSEITGVRRIIYGHTHQPRHEYYGSIEHLNSGTWSPGFTNVECTESVERNNYIWIYPTSDDQLSRKAELLQFIGSKIEKRAALTS